MGVIRRQSIKSNFLSYFAVAIGAVAQIVIFPQDRSTAGLAQTIAKWAVFLAPYLVFGTGAVMVRYLPYLEGGKAEKSSRLLLRSLAVVTLLSALIIGINNFFGEQFARWMFEKGYDEDGILKNYRAAIIAIAAALAYAGVLTVHLSNFQRITVPVIFNNILLKVGLPLLVLGVVWSGLSLTSFVGWYVSLFWVAVAGLLIYAIKLRSIQFTSQPLGLPKANRREIYSVAGFSILSSAGSELSSSIDLISVGGILGVDAATIYGFSAYAVSVMSIPSRAVNNISAPLVAKAWKERNTEELQRLYQDSASVLFVAGGYILVGLLVCLPFLYGLMKEGSVYAVGYNAVLFLGFSRLFDCMTSINGVLISVTSYFRWNLVFTTIMGLSNLLLNYYFLVVLEMGLTGPALATTLALAVFNLGKFLLVKQKIGISPWSASQGWTALALAVIGGMAYLMPLPDGPWINIVMRGGLITLLVFLYLRYTRAVPVVREALESGVFNLHK